MPPPPLPPLSVALVLLILLSAATYPASATAAYPESATVHSLDPSAASRGEASPSPDATDPHPLHPDPSPLRHRRRLQDDGEDVTTADKVLLFSILTVSFAISRVVIPWCLAGGRVRLIRDGGTGRIVGVRIVSPSPEAEAWGWTRRRGATRVTAEPAAAGGKHLSEEEVLALPEITFLPADKAGKDRDGKGEDGGGGARNEAENNSETTMGATDYSALGTNNEGYCSSKGCGGEHVAASSPTHARGDGSSENDGASAAEMGDAHVAVLDDSLAPVAATKASAATEPNLDTVHTTTTCTACSICIDDFVAGERIRLLPACGHAFHTSCILPWLTERSGCCPLCKRDVCNKTEGPAAR